MIASGSRRWPGFVVFLLVATVSVVRAETETDGSVWGAVVAQGSAEAISPKLERYRWWLEGQLRYRDDAGAFDQGILRTGVGYTIAPRTALWLGYGWFRTSPDGGSDFDEHRIWQQFTWSTPVDPLAFSIRTRLEQRFVETGDDVGWRFRHLGKFIWPVWGRVGPVLWDEIFLNLNSTDWGASSGFDQNRLFAGLGWDMDRSRHLRLEAGYLNQFSRKSGAPDKLNHILAISLLLNY